MTVRPGLIVLNARTIPAVIDAITALQPDAGTAWLTGYTETELAQYAFADAIQRLPDATHLIVITDDCEPTTDAYQAIVEHLHHQPDTPVTGWVVADEQPGQTQTSVTLPLRGTDSVRGAYTFLDRPEVLAAGHTIRTGLACFALTGMSRQAWDAYPFGCYGPGGTPVDGQPYGWASDFHLSIRLRDAGIPIVAPVAAECHHHRADWQSPDHRYPLDRMGKRTTTITR